jgi:hypothetical protein
MSSIGVGTGVGIGVAGLGVDTAPELQVVHCCVVS